MAMKIVLKVRGKLLLPILSVVFLGILGLLLFTYMESSALLEKEIGNGIQRESEAASRAMQEWIEGRKRDMQNWARNSGYLRFLEGDEDAFPEAMRTLSGKLTDFSYYEAVNLLDSSGKVVAGGEQATVGIDLADREYFQQAVKGEVVISEALKSRVSGKPIFVIAVPVRSDEARILGVLIGVIKLDQMTSTFIDKVKIGANGYAFVLDNKGLVLGHPDQTFIMQLNVADTDFGKVALERQNGQYKYWFAQQSQWKMMGFNEIPATGWIVAVTAPLTELLLPLEKVRNYALLGGVVVLLLVALVIFYFVGKVTRVLGDAVTHLKELAEGDVDREVAVQALKINDELGDMARGFKAMVDAQRVRAELAKAIAGGDLTREVQVASDKDRLGLALDEMVKSLNDIMGQIGAAAEQVQSGSGQVSESSQALSQGATEQASSLEEITSSVTEISSQTRTNAENASQASRLASQARDAATEGDREMKNMVAAMQDINQSSQAISKIIKVIDEIAFQTNLLALNAAVEAARAGQHGKGFAVVAEEVRNLASRSAKAAQETAQLIEGSVVKVGKGSEIAAQTAESLQQIVDKAARVADLVAEIAAASDEQAKGVNQINIGLGQIDQVTQQNTANAEETASASEELSSQAVEMRRLVGRFRLHRNEMRAVNAPRLALVNRNGNRAPQLPPSTSSSPSSASGRKEEKPRAQAQARQVRSTASARPASEGAWAAGGNQNGAGGAAKSAAEVIRPEDVIALDDDEFGRY
ncbi:MAG: methyl-accepting chemotaxis protein [Desulfovibrio sp.]